ncbi:M3 family oligoendopeptidase [Salisediminibacterium selenitireducens]|uniref:Oligoendopeptidase, M3 family n=1 Tax=Bacillus selenitireducens (strain ATCC 700615 / DSM 15326 / MLS10) TaxID=439292 RepID=D6XX47_BACIE|nr:M3 family oligoendopeptidase [Salisediminibacterium selenitireducens]ADI00024.1 oligoendopeptidase, M3 family [[Bacillus] selenitireducens MLS10]
MSRFYQETLPFDHPEDIEQQLIRLLTRDIDSAADLEQWLKDQTVLYDQLEEGMTGHYIDFQCQSDSEEARKTFEHDQTIIEPLLKKYEAELDRKFLDSPFVKDLNSTDYERFIKTKENARALFRPENIALEVDENKLATDYFEHTGGLMVSWNGEELTLSELAVYLQDDNRDTRKDAFLASGAAFQSVQAELQAIMDDLLVIRQKKAEHADLDNYRDYMFKKYQRFDYTPNDCHTLAHAVKQHVTPLKEQIAREHQDNLGVDTYRPWDTKAVLPGLKPLKPFENRDGLVRTTHSIFNQLDPRFADLLDAMDKGGMLDLTTRKGKAPGGFCAPLPVSGLSFIFMNAANTQDDMITLLHEMGHCIHNDMKKDIPLAVYKDTPMESSELASMTMELFTMDQWDKFYDDPEDLRRARKEHLEGIIQFLPMGVAVDQFQHWMYENPTHTAEERNQKFRELQIAFNGEVVDWSGYESYAESSWLRILHIFEVPFYFIEYVIAQLGALQMFKQYRENPEAALENYKKALAMGAKGSLFEVYEAAGISFDFSASKIEELMTFLQEELQKVS